MISSIYGQKNNKLFLKQFNEQELEFLEKFNENKFYIGVDDNLLSIIEDFKHYLNQLENEEQKNKLFSSVLLIELLKTNGTNKILNTLLNFENVKFDEKTFDKINLNLDNSLLEKFYIRTLDSHNPYLLKFIIDNYQDFKFDLDKTKFKTLDELFVQGNFNYSNNYSFLEIIKKNNIYDFNKPNINNIYESLLDTFKQKINNMDNPSLLDIVSVGGYRDMVNNLYSLGVDYNLNNIDNMEMKEILESYEKSKNNLQENQKNLKELIKSTPKIIDEFIKQNNIDSFNSNELTTFSEKLDQKNKEIINLVNKYSYEISKGEVGVERDKNLEKYDTNNHLKQLFEQEFCK